MIHYTAWELPPYLAKMQHYADQQATLWHHKGRRPQPHHLLLNAPMRFLRSYLLNLGFLDGMIGFHLASLTAYYSFLKQFMHWQKFYGRTIEDFDSQFETENEANVDAYAARREEVGSSEARLGSRAAA